MNILAKGRNIVAYSPTTGNPYAISRKHDAVVYERRNGNRGELRISFTTPWGSTHDKPLKMNDWFVR